MGIENIKRELQALANPQKAKDLQWFFKTGVGQYGAGDQFIGIVVPNIRKVVKLYWDVVDLSDIQKLLESPTHEFRLAALLILVKQYPKNKKTIYDFYLKNTKYINNWDLVDLSCHHIIGAYCYEHKDSSIIESLSQTTDLWKKRISIVSTAYFIKNNDFDLTIKICKTLLNDSHDLIHKAVGWMLREVGKRDQKVLTDFLDIYALQMPRTALRYSIEKFPEPLRLHYLKLKP